SVRTEQVWFAGCHSDIGGGCISEACRVVRKLKGLDDITLDWLLKRLTALFPSFPVQTDGKRAWIEIPPPRQSTDDTCVRTQPECYEWVKADQHESRRGLYRIFPSVLRSIANHPIPGVRNVSYDRHSSAVGEMLHISVIERLGRDVKIDKR